MDAGESPYDDARLRGDPLHDPLVAVVLVHRADALEDRGAALEPEPRVDVLRGQRRQRPVRVLLVRHEDEVPELEKPVTARARGRAVRLAAAVLLAPVPEDLGVRAARAGAADGPEVLDGRQRNDALGRHSDPLPELDRVLVGPELQLRVTGVHRDPDAIPVELHALLDELRRECDRALLEVLPEREVAEHLEEGQVMAVEPDIVDVDGAEALLRRRRERRRRWLETEEVRHLRLHAGGREKARLVVGARNQGGRRHAQVILFLEEREKALAQLGGRLACRDSTSALSERPDGLRRGWRLGLGPGLRRGGARPGVSSRIGGGPSALQLRVELRLAPAGGLLRDVHGFARTPSRAERGETVRHGRPRTR